MTKKRRENKCCVFKDQFVPERPAHLLGMAEVT